MDDYVLIAGPLDQPALRCRLEAIKLTKAWRWALQSKRFWLAVRTQRPARCAPFWSGSGLGVGDVVGLPLPAHADPGAGAAFERRALTLAGSVISNSWGRYVLVVTDVDGETVAVFRDPSGAQEALLSSLYGAAVVTSQPPAWLRSQLDRALSVDLDRAAILLADAAAFSGPPPLQGLDWVAPGQLAVRAARGRLTSELLWRPGRIAAADPAPHGAAARLLLERSVDRAVAGLLGDCSPALVEISGGLDSAVVAAAVAQASAAPVTGLNFYGDHALADERAYARAVAETLGVDLLFKPRQSAPWTEAVVHEASRGMRPAPSGLDAARIATVADVVRERGFSAVFTGQGGDAALLQQPSAAIFADQWRAQGVSSLCNGALTASARRLKRSVWSVGWEALAPGRRMRPATSPLVSREGRRLNALPPHPWVQDAEGLGPAKRLQVSALVTAQAAYHNPLARQVDVIHPLLSQPVLESCLTIPAWELGGPRDRHLAREAFRARLPESVYRRGSKGDLTAFFGQAIRDSLSFIRPFLMDGRLAAAGILDRDALDAALDPDQLLWKGGYQHIARAVAVEGWVSHWR